MQRNEKVANQIKELSAQFLARENNRTSLITVIHCDASPDLKRATIFITVLPTSKETSALDFVKRKLKELREYLKKNMPIKIIPFLDVEIDQGEKNRQKIDELLWEK
jgi:ribosome-binding factor A